MGMEEGIRMLVKGTGLLPKDMPCNIALEIDRELRTEALTVHLQRTEGRSAPARQLSFTLGGSTLLVGKLLAVSTIQSRL